MSGVNKAILIGRLGKDPELTYTPSGKEVVKFSVATSETWKDQSGAKQGKTVWHNIVAWGRIAEICKEYLTKGKQVYIEGRIDNRSYDKQDGSKGYISEVVASTVQFLGSANNKGDNTATGDNQGQQSPANDDDLPF